MLAREESGMRCCYLTNNHVQGTYCYPSPPEIVRFGRLLMKFGHLPTCTGVWAPGTLRSTLTIKIYLW